MTEEAQIITCPKCDTELVVAKSQEKGDIQKVTFTCVCGHNVVETFIGHPFLGCTEDCIFEPLSETEYKCLKI